MERLMVLQCWCPNTMDVDSTPMNAAERQQRMLQELAKSLDAELIETQISYVLLVGEYAYKFKKILCNGWLDYRDIAARRHCCEEELRLNIRLAPELYLGLSVLTVGTHQPVLDGDGPMLDYAVRMRRFDARALWSWRLAHGLLGTDEVRRFGILLANFHQTAARATVATGWGSEDAIIARTGADLAELEVLVAHDVTMRDMLAVLAKWLQDQERRLAARFVRRQRGGWVRECHGDLHCGNILSWAGKVRAFDGIEFNAGMRWTDVQQDLAFICMDLQVLGRRDLAAQLIDAYLQASGDYSGLILFPYYCCQRALVRAKVALLQARQQLNGAVCIAEANRYLTWALQNTVRAAPVIIATHGLSGSGKSLLCASLVGPLAAVQIRSDIERKRLCGLAANKHVNAAPGAGLYQAHITRLTYGRVLRQALMVTAAGMPVLLDAAFLLSWQRRRLRRLAHYVGARCLLLDVVATPSTLRQRLLARAGAPQQCSDAGISLMAYQWAMQDLLRSDELVDVLVIDNNRSWGAEQTSSLVRTIRNRLELP